ncbi:MAG: ribulose-phosphate 3-epimerase [Desulfobacteraceae bacterium]|jgi:ribulose-phosphate 3-epimerase|nr:MAG: ribulose-phosphate 3-epimerase [Desulfobacteraceae bacterium]
MGKIAPSILSADFARLGDEISAVERAGADYIHIDVMDGHFVPNITAGPPIVRAVRKITSLPLDVHLMITEPDRYIDDFADAGSTFITVHAETATHLHRTIQHIKASGAKPGVSLNPATPLHCLEYILKDLSMVLLMTVNPGFGGQEFIRDVVPKVIALKKMIISIGYSVDIEVDGGINTDTISEVASAGADVFVAGSAIFNSNDYGQTIRVLKEKAENKNFS